MRLYADLPGVRLRQLLSDLMVAAWVGFWVWVAFWVYDRVSVLAVPGEKIEGAGVGISSGLSDAGARVGDVPAVGDELASPFNRAASAADVLADAGRAQQDAVQNLAIALVVLVLIAPLGIVVFGWLPLRLRWVNRAALAASLRSRPSGRDLLALRALTHQPLRRLLPIHPDPATAWRDREEATTRALANLELRSLGLRPHP